jgi:hypothetical protein
MCGKEEDLEYIFRQAGIEASWNLCLPGRLQRDTDLIGFQTRLAGHIGSVDFTLKIAVKSVRANSNDVLRCPFGWLVAQMLELEWNPLGVASQPST